ncbi:hypothetical protein C8J57DRAFT_1216764 [Mycena rebaudengoi]|nr:hypothetical protein C8J57DRAFT_1216764 [Mycena rebaudengoi]
MYAILGVIDPALLEVGRESGVAASVTNGVTSPRLRSPAQPALARSTRRTVADIKAWSASNYAPRREANESRSDYDDELTRVSRRSPLLEACGRLGIQVAKSTNLLKLEASFSLHSTGTSAASSTRIPPPHTESRKRRPAEPHEVLTSVLVPNLPAIQFAAPPGALPAVASNTPSGNLTSADLA